MYLAATIILAQGAIVAMGLLLREFDRYRDWSHPYPEMGGNRPHWLLLARCADIVVWYVSAAILLTGFLFRL